MSARTQAPGVSGGKEEANVYSRHIFLRDVLDGLVGKDNYRLLMGVGRRSGLPSP